MSSHLLLATCRSRCITYIWALCYLILLPWVKVACRAVLHNGRSTAAVLLSRSSRLFISIQSRKKHLPAIQQRASKEIPEHELEQMSAPPLHHQQGGSETGFSRPY